MSRLSLRIFLSFFAAMLVIGAGAILITWWVLADRQDEAGAGLREATRGAAQALSVGGRDGLREWLRSDAAQLRGQPLLVLDESGAEMLGRPVPRRRGLRMAPDAAHHFDAAPGVTLRPPHRLPTLVARDGETFSLLLPPRATPGFGPFGMPDTRGPLLALALIVTALVSGWLARSITRPVRDLQRATTALAAGDLATRVAASTSSRGDELGRLGLAFDSMAARLTALIDAREQLLRDVSHELRSPLARMRLATGLARQQGADTPRQLERVELEIGRLDELIGSILDVSRLESGTGVLATEELDLVALVERVAADARFEADSLGRKLHWQAPDQALPVRADPGWLTAAVENVVRNALRHTPEGTTVSVGVASAADAAIVRISDCGKGLPEAELERVFEPFYRVERDRNRSSGGTGLGLAIAARVMRAHGGSIVARNLPGTAAGAGPAGLELTLRLPRAVVPSPAAHP